MAPRIGLLGCGRWGRNHARVLMELRVLTAVHDPKGVPEGLPRAESLEQFFGLVDAVVIATPAPTHAQLALMALKRGLDVFVEKPMATRVTDAERMVELAEERDRVLMVGHLLHYHPAVRLMLERAPGIQPRYVHAIRANVGRVRHDEDVLWSFAPHDLSLIAHLAQVEPLDVSVSGRKCLGREVCDATTTHLSFPGALNGPLEADVFASWLHPTKIQTFTIVGAAGALSYDGVTNELVEHEPLVEWTDGRPEERRRLGRKLTFGDEEPLRAEMAEFLRCVISRNTPPTDGDEGLDVLRILERCSDALEPPTLHETVEVEARSRVGARSKLWHYSRVLKDSTVGTDCRIGQNVVIGPNVIVGDRVKIQNNVSVYEGVEIADDVFVGPSVVFTNVKNPRAPIPRKDEYRPTKVRRGASIGANATIVCGVTLGAHCFVAAGAVVTKDVPSHALVAGVPAKVIGPMCRCGERPTAETPSAEYNRRTPWTCACGLRYERTTDDGWRSAE